MRRFFDAFVYTANWCCHLALRFPHPVFRNAELKRFATKYALTIDESDAHWIVNWALNEGANYERFDIESGQGWMGRLMPLRDELLRGDLRPLYLGWLVDVTSGEVGDNVVEPEVPPGMSQLSAAQQALVEFLEIDPDLVAAAAAGSSAAAESDDDDSIEVWLAGLSKNEMGAILELLLQGASQQAERQVKSAFLAWQKESTESEASPTKQRKVTELRTLAKEAEKLRLGHEAKKRARQEADQRKKREAYLKTLAADFDRCWSAIHPHAERGTASAYDEAKRAIVDLSDAYALVSSKEVFDRALRLVEAGLWQK